MIRPVAVSIGITVGMGVITAILYFGAAFLLGVIADGNIPKQSDSFFAALADYVQIIAVFAVLFVYKKTHSEKTAYIKIGKRNIPQFLIGLIAGAVIVLITVAIMYYIGAIVIERNSECSAGWLIVLLGGVIVQSAGEEYIFRGYLLPELAEHIKKPWAIAIGSLMFSLVHTGSAETAWMYLINLFLLGVLLSELTLLTGNIMAAAGVHAGINFLAEMGFGGMSYSCFSIVPLTEAAQTFTPLNSMWGIYIIALFIEAVLVYEKRKETGREKGVRSDES